MKTSKKYKTREEWLMAAIELLRPMFKHSKAKIPAKVKVSLGWPSGSRKRVAGEAWSPNVSDGKFHEIFISPAVNDDVAAKDGALSVLVHELIHTSVGLKCGHKGEFKRVFKELGLEGRVKASVAGDYLISIFIDMQKKLGVFPHKKMSRGDSSGPKKQTTRLLKVMCPECGYTARVTRIWLDEAGAPLCPIHKKPFEEA